MVHATQEASPASGNAYVFVTLLMTYSVLTCSVTLFPLLGELFGQRYGII